jgi:hypothetical protein
MVNPLDTTLEALQNTQDAIDEIKVRKTSHQKNKRYKIMMI